MSCGSCSLGSSFNPGGNYVGVRVSDAEDGKTTLVFVGEAQVRSGERIIIEGDEGPEFAQVMTVNPVLAKPCSSRKARRFLRLASDSESADFAERIEVQSEAHHFAETRAAALGLDLSVVKCSLGFDKRKMVVLYTSEDRVNTRDLAREMSDRFRIRVDLRAVGVRDETKLIGGLGPCGLTLCCSTWLKGFHPVTIRMAKAQGITPNPSKLTGMCGRLKCCLAYELEGGIEAARRMSAKGAEKRPIVPPAPVPPVTEPA